MSAAGRQRTDMRLGGQYVSITGPIKPPSGAPFPTCGVAGVVIAKEEVVARCNARPAVGPVSPRRWMDVGLHEALAVDVDGAVSFRDQLAGKSDDALDECRAAGTRFAPLGRGSLEDDDLSALGITEPVRKPVRDHAVVESARRSRRASQWSVLSIDEEGMRYGFATAA